LNAAALRASLVKNAAERRDLHIQIGVLDHRRRPNGGHELVPRDELSWLLCQGAENVEGARAQRHRYERVVLAPPKQCAGIAVEPKAFEYEGSTPAKSAHSLPRAPEYSEIYRN
jgi:hypothetical protein